MYTALKPCNFGKQYYIGDVIEEGLVDPSQLKRLIENKIIAPAPVKEPEQTPKAEARETTASSKPKNRKPVAK